MKKSILLFGSYPPPYHGSSIYLRDLTELLIKDGEFDVIRINCSSKNKGLTELGSWTFTNAYNALIAIIRLILKLIFKKIDIVYIPIAQNKNAFFRDGIAIILSKVFGKKVLIHLHGSYFKEFYDKSGFLCKKFIDLSMKSCEGAIVLGKNLKYIFENWFDDSKIFVLTNFVPNRGFKKNINNEKNPINVIYLSNILKSKGIFELLEAFKIIKHSFNNTSLIIVGKIIKDPFFMMTADETKREFNKMLKNLDNVEYVGAISDVEKKMNILINSDIFVLPSWYPVEGQPLSIIEAMSCGLPIISTKNVGAIEEVVTDGFNGILVEKKNVEQLAKAIETLIIDKEKRIKMGKNSYQKYLEHHTPEQHIRKFKEIINTINDN